MGWDYNENVFLVFTSSICMVFVGSLWLISSLCMAPLCKETCDFSWYNMPSNQGHLPPKKVLSSPSLNFYDKLCHFFTQNMGKFWIFLYF